MNPLPLDQVAEETAKRVHALGFPDCAQRLPPARTVSVDAGPLAHRGCRGVCDVLGRHVASPLVRTDPVGMLFSRPSTSDQDGREHPSYGRARALKDEAIGAPTQAIQMARNRESPERAPD